jgi:hypothetical protein
MPGLGRSIRSVCAPVIGLLVLVSLGAGAAGGTAQPNPCGVLKAAEIKKVFGGHVAKGSRNADLCGWDINGGIGVGGALIHVSLDTDPGAAQNYAGFARDQTVITGIGDSAFYDSTLGFHVLKGHSYLVVNATFGILGKQPSHAAIRARLIRLVQIALKRI